MSHGLGEPPAIQAVLDRSALRSYAQGHVHVGELLIDVADEGSSMAIPTVALFDAFAESRGDERAMALLSLLLTLPGIAVINLDAKTALAASAEVSPAKGDLSRSHAVWAAKEHDAYFLTTEPGEVEELLPPAQIHVIPATDM
jgi:hypothetical protein